MDDNDQCCYCEHVNRGYDDCSHPVHWVSERCPLTEILEMYKKIHMHTFPIEWITSFTGCRHFKEDTEYTKQQKEIDDVINERHKQNNTSGVK